MRRDSSLIFSMPFVALVGCGAFSSLDGFSGGVDADSGAPSDAGTSANDGPALDVSSDASADACVRRPTTARAITPDGSVGFACNVLEGIVSDGKLAGMDTESGPSGAFAGQDGVSACIAFEFDADVGGRAFVDVGTVRGACGGTCNTSSNCSGSAALKIFVGATVETAAFTEIVTLPTAAAEAGIQQRAVALPSTARVIVLCRVATGRYEDPAVDGITADCR